MRILRTSEELDKFRQALRKHDQKTLSEFVDRLDRESIGLDEGSEKLVIIKQRINLARDVIREKRGLASAPPRKSKQRPRRRKKSKPFVPRISIEDRYDSWGRAPLTSEPQNNKRGVMQIPPRRSDQKR